MSPSSHLHVQRSSVDCCAPGRSGGGGALLVELSPSELGSLACWDS